MDYSKSTEETYDPPAISKSTIDRTARVGSGSNVVCSVIGQHSYAGNYCLIVNTEIGRYCSIADYCYIGPTEHMMNWGSTSPVFHEGRNMLKVNFSNHETPESKKTVIGNDVWIGAMVMIKNGVNIGDGAVIGMGSVVTKDVPPYSIAVGNPARVLKQRFNPETITLMEKSRWYELGEDKIKNISQKVKEPREFAIEALKAGETNDAGEIDKTVLK